MPKEKGVGSRAARYAHLLPIWWSALPCLQNIARSPSGESQGYGDARPPPGRLQACWAASTAGFTHPPLLSVTLSGLKSLYLSPRRRGRVCTVSSLQGGSLSATVPLSLATPLWQAASWVNTQPSYTHRLCKGG